jgi:hypothetical protein
MFENGSILYFTPFRFRDGSKPKNKYFIVLKVQENQTLLASLPSSQLYLPQKMAENWGCLQDSSADIGAYLFQENQTVGKRGFHFQKPTILYGQYLELYSITDISERYQIPEIDYLFVDVLLDEILTSIIECFNTAPTVKQKIKRFLLT